ncbi:hypothetical protein IMZ31_10965 [Pontibacillus sp. ALD_SL1]|uniref:hypothetical protein n=1 Tax=Pontibacillus sp. ALD_SL1 TaxID=2777185 RepID=UPI001A96FB7A|nr:hypothetical protein [Pontibacillus sp. ALD_SL1]QSS98631.1 hypothetical protein IMZ31_10965 [Pontibacillus sp. ALD_SL1]
MQSLPTFIVSAIGFFFLYYFEITNLWLIALFGVLLVVFAIFPTLNILLWEKNILKIERFLLKNKKNLTFYTVYALANGLDEEIQSTTEKLVSKSKHRSRQALYKIGEALHFKDLEAANEELSYITAPAYRAYYEGFIRLEEGDLAQANRIIDETKTTWMKNALMAERERLAGHLDEAILYAEEAKKNSKGLQYYTLHKTFERELGI